MMASRKVRALVLSFSSAVLGASVMLGAQQAKPQFKPEVGQPGKDVVWVPTSQTLVNKMLDMAKVTQQDFVIDLGSGDGRTVITAAKRGAHAMGVEYNPEMVELSKQNAENAHVTGRVTFVQADLFETDLSKATVITMFLLPEINMKLRPKLLSLKPGTRIVSNSFTMEDWTPDATETVTDDCSSWCTALLWIVPARVDGTWRTAQGEMRLTQEFQMLSGTVKSGAVETPITEGRMRGDEISFLVGASRYTGRVNGDRMEGTATAGGVTRSWTATRAAQ